MKKFLSALLALCMILSVCFLIASCTPADDGDDGDGEGNKGPGSIVGTKVSADDLKNNTLAALAIVSNNTNNQFFGEPDNSAAVLESAVNGGSIQFLFETSDLLGDLTEISETIYMNGKDFEFVSDTAVKYDGDVLGGRIFINKDGLMLNSSDILGSDKTLAVSLDTFFEKFTTSALAQMIFGGDTPAEVEDTIAQIKNALDNFEMPSIELDPSILEDIQEICNDLNMTVTEETVDGVDCFVVTVTINNENIKTVVNKFMDIMMEFEGEMLKKMVGAFSNYLPMSPDEMLDQLEAEMNAMIDEMFAAMDENLDIDISIKTNINKETSTYTSIVIDGKIANPAADEGDSYDETGIMSGLEVNGVLSFTNDKIALDVDVIVDGNEDNSVGADFEITKSEKDGVTTYKANAGAYFKDMGETVFDSDVINATFTYNKNNGEFSFAAEVGTDVDDGETIVFIIDGKYKADNNTVTFELNSITVDSFSVRFRFAVIINAKADIPEVPADAKDIVDLTEEEIMEIMEEVQNSPLVALINKISASQPQPEPDYGYNDYAA